jgi:hypothetical protein
MNGIPPYVWVSLGTVVAVGMVAAVAKAVEPGHQRLNGHSLVVVRRLIENAIRMTKQAAQDASTTQRLTDICFGLGYVNTARMIATDASIEDKCGIKIDEVSATLRALQQECLLEMEK